MKQKQSWSSSLVPQIHKFGGASVADADAIRHAVSIVRDLSCGPIVVAVSAMAGVTDSLIDVADHAAQGDRKGVDRRIYELAKRHRLVAQQLVKGKNLAAALLRDIEAHFQVLSEVAHGLIALRGVTARSRDYILARGEMLSVLLFAAAARAGG